MRESLLVEVVSKKKEMKKKLKLLVFLLTGLLFINSLSVFAINVPAAIDIPDNVQQIINKSCYDCHNTASSNKKAKKKLITS